MKEVEVKDFNIESFKLFAKDFSLLGVKKNDSYNEMTISWGYIGSIWGHGSGKLSCIVLVRPQRYTFEFIENNNYFSLSFFDEEYKKDLLYLGSHSGRNEDKLAKTNIHLKDNILAPRYKEAKLTFICRTMYKDKIKEENFIDLDTLKDVYPLKDFHTLYIAEIEKIYIKD